MRKIYPNLLAFLLIAVVVFATTASELQTDTDTPDAPIPEFVPTHEWQEILPGQGIPPGLWVRIDMTTGKRMARLMDNQGVDASASQVEAQPQQPGTPSDEPVLSLPAPPSDSPSPPVALPDRVPLQPIQAFESDYDVMVRLVSSLQATNPNASLCSMQSSLEELEELVHDLDNALDFVQMGGFDLVKSILLMRTSAANFSAEPHESTSHFVPHSSITKLSPLAPVECKEQSPGCLQLQARAASCLGTASQNMEKVQHHALDSGAWDVLLDLLHHSSQQLQVSDSVELKLAHLQLQHRVIYAIASILRSRPEARDRLLASSTTLAAIQKILSAPTQDAEDLRKAQRRVQIKALNLLEDLIINTGAAQAGSSQWSSLDALCPALTHLVTSPDAGPNTDIQDLSIRVLYLMTRPEIQGSACRAQLASQQVKSALAHTITSLQKQAEEARDEEYLVADLRQKIDHASEILKVESA